MTPTVGSLNLTRIFPHSHTINQTLRFQRVTGLCFCLPTSHTPPLFSSGSLTISFVSYYFQNLCRALTTHWLVAKKSTASWTRSSAACLWTGASSSLTLVCILTPTSTPHAHMGYFIQVYNAYTLVYACTHTHTHTRDTFIFYYHMHVCSPSHMPARTPTCDIHIHHRHIFASYVLTHRLLLMCFTTIAYPPCARALAQGDRTNSGASGARRRKAAQRMAQDRPSWSQSAQSPDTFVLS